MAEAKARTKLLDPSSTTKPENISQNDSGNNTHSVSVNTTQNLSGITTQNLSGNTTQNQFGNTTLNVSENSLVVTASTHNLSGLSESKTKNLTDEGNTNGNLYSFPWLCI